MLIKLYLRVNFYKTQKSFSKSLQLKDGVCAR